MPDICIPADLVASVREGDRDSQWAAIVDVFSPQLNHHNLSIWIKQLDRVIGEVQVDTAQARSIVGRLAWLAREACCPMPRPLDPPEDYTSSQALLWCWFVGERLRYDFRFRDLGLAVPQWRKRFPSDSLLTAFEAYARLALRDATGDALYDAALSSADVDDRVQSVCMHGMTFSLGSAPHCEKAVALANEMLDSGTRAAHVILYRKAMALRSMGQHGEAIESIDRAISELEVNDSSFVDIHQDYVRERELIVTTELFAKQSEEMMDRFRREAAETIATQLSKAEETISESLLKLVEILGLFVTLAGFLAASGAVALKAATWGETALSVTLIAAGSIAFFLLLRLVVRSRSRRRH